MGFPGRREKRMRRRTVRLFLAGILVAGSLALGCQKKGEQQKVETTPFTGDPTMVVGKVGDDGILLGDVDKLVQMWKNGKAPGFEGMSDREIQRKALDQLIDQKVLLAASRKEGLTPDENQINEVMQSLAARFGSPEVFQQVLAQQGMTEADLRGNVAIDMAIRSYLEKVVPDTAKVTPEQAQAYYSANPDKFMAPEKIHARHILVKVDPAATPEQKEAARKKAQGLLEKVKGGADFATVAKESSDCPSAPQGGDLGEFGRGDMVKAFEDAAFNLKPGDMSDLVETQFGYHIIRLEGKTPPTKVDYTPELEGQLTQQLLSERRNEAVKKLIADLRGKASIDRKL
jgi:peptidyl-prolyl cis-trans isomerase C